MKVFKFGGASVRDADAVKNLAGILSGYSNEKIVVVISAMGKTTNALEEIVSLAYQNKNYDAQLQKLYDYHTNIIRSLGMQTDISYFIDLIVQNAEANRHFTLPQYYDQIVSTGELISTTIVQQYLQSAGAAVHWIDARDLIATDNTWREGSVDWEMTAKQVQHVILPVLEKEQVITQGFIGKTSDGFTTTLGREGSDYTGAILANILNAEALYIWKDVPGVLNADPKLFSETVNIHEITYYEAIEMTYYGATVIHPKTIKPLQNKQIPLQVRSFVDASLPGTIIHHDDAAISYPPVIIVKKDQTLISVYTNDLSFIAEKNLSRIYEILAEYNVKVNMMQTAAVSCTICMDTNDYKKQKLEEALSKEYSVEFNTRLELLTIRHYTKDMIEKLTAGKEILLTQKSRNTIQLLY